MLTGNSSNLLDEFIAILVYRSHVTPLVFVFINWSLLMIFYKSLIWLPANLPPRLSPTMYLKLVGSLQHLTYPDIALFANIIANI